jgi:hypothetical protein
MSEAKPPLPHTSSWCGACLSTGTTLPLPLPFHIFIQNFVKDCTVLTRTVFTQFLRLEMKIKAENMKREGR